MAESKKVTFGFTKVIKKPNLMGIKKIEESSKVEMIKCLEGKSIQLLEEKSEVGPLVIPLLNNGITSGALASMKKRREVLDGLEPEPIEVKESQNVIGIANPETDTLEAKAVRELLAESNKLENETSSNLVLPLKVEDLPLDGAKESSMDDYENIPIHQFGLAMLRGMGWKEDVEKKKTLKDIDSPLVRPKGMGLGADKAIKPKPLLVAPESNEVLEIKKNAYVRILAGKHKDHYGQIEGLDDHAGSVFVKMALGGSKESFNEFLVQPVSRKEFQQYGKVINSEKYNEYKKMENEFGQIKSVKLEKELKKEKVEDRWKHDKFEDDGIDRYLMERKQGECTSKDGKESRRGDKTNDSKYRDRDEKYRSSNDNPNYYRNDNSYRSSRKDEHFKEKDCFRTSKHESEKTSVSNDDHRKSHKKSSKSMKHRSRDRSHKSHKNKYNNDDKSMKRRHRSRSKSKGRR